MRVKQYHDLVNHVFEHGVSKSDRTGTGTRSVFGYQMRFDLDEGFPLLTTKKVHLKSIIHELLWFIQGSTNIRPLVLENVRIWNEWPYAVYQKSPHFQGESLETFIEKIKSDEQFALTWGDLGPVYGKQWRHFEGKQDSVDQLLWVINEIKENPHSRRLIVNSWNPPLIEQMALPPCHMMFQFYVEGEHLSLQLYQRSADIFLGVPFNIASYALLLMMVAQVTGLKAKTFVHTLGDAHIYNDHIEALNLQLSREPRTLPTMVINSDVRHILDFKYEDFILEDYHPHPAIKAKVSV